MATVTLLSDFGTHDASVAIVKGVLMQHVPGIDIIDISHEIKPFMLREAAYILGTSWYNFPDGTIHIALVDIFSEVKPRLILSEESKHFFLSADNGLIPLSIGKQPGSTWLCAEFIRSETFIDWVNKIGTIIGKLQNSKPGTLNLQKHEITTKQFPANKTNESNIIYCDVVHIDRYENVVLNCTKQQFEAFGNGRDFEIQFKQVEKVNRISPNYKNVREGDKLCRFNSAGYLEICINKGKAASILGLKLGSPNNEIKIVFQ